MNQPTPAQLQALLQYASSKLGVSPEQLLRTVADNRLDSLQSSLSKQGQESLNNFLNDPAKRQALLSSPQVQQLLSKLSK